MRSLTKIWLRLRSLAHRERAAQELDDELRFHLEKQIAINVAAGMPPDEARRSALREFGAVDQIREECTDMRRVNWLQDFFQDVRFGARMLRKSPGFTTVAVLTLGLGIGANTAIFSALNGMWLRRLPYADASRLVAIVGYKRFSDGMRGEITFSPDIWREVRAQTPAIQGLALYGNQQTFTLTGEAVPEAIGGVKVSGDFFPLLGTRPLLGRPIVSTDTRSGARAVVVLNYALWHSSFGANPKVIGRTATLDGEPYRIIGVMPGGFILPLYKSKEVWLPYIPAVTPKANEQSGGLAVVARLKTGVTIERANTELKTVSSRLTKYFKGFMKGGYFLATPLKTRFGDLDTALLILLGAVGFVLLIACVNVSGLSLGRGWARQREVAVRQALGASRMRIVRQFLTESVLLALCGGALGLLLSVWGVHILRAITPPDAPEHGHFQLDLNVLWFTLAASLFTGILFGLAPALQASAREAGATIKENLGGLTAGFSRPRTKYLQDALAAIEVALAVTLVIGATLALRSFKNLMSVDLGFRTDHILGITPLFSKAICDPDKIAASCELALDSALHEIRTAPGVQSAAFTSTFPLADWQIATTVRVQGRTHEISLGSGTIIEKRAVSSGYFRTMGIPLLSGRGFDATDTANGPAVAIVDEAFARAYLGDAPLGRRISDSNDKKGLPEWIEVVGIVGNARDFINPKRTPYPEIYIPFTQAMTFSSTTYLARTTADPMAVAPGIKRAIWAVDKRAPITDVATMDQVVQEVTAQPRFQTTLLGAFAGLGLLMAAIGIYGVISYAVALRTHEIGVRMALGAQRADVLRIVIGEGAVLAGIGIAAGIAGALALTRFLRGLLFGISPTDPATFAGVALALLLLALLACYVPARRAMRVDPMVALRHE
jgi:putative ABC transport system permease protein